MGDEGDAKSKERVRTRNMTEYRQKAGEDELCYNHVSWTCRAF